MSICISLHKTFYHLILSVVFKTLINYITIQQDFLKESFSYQAVTDTGGINL